MARLSVRHAGAITSLVNDDDTCGFSSADVIAAGEVRGEGGGPGSVVLSIDCTYDFAEPTLMADGDCRGEGALRGMGAFRVRGTRTVSGLLTGDEAQPILPEGPEAVVMALEVEITSLEVLADGDGRSLTLGPSTLSFTAQPRLAVSTDPEAPGICSAPTGNVRFTDLTLAAPADAQVAVPELDEPFSLVVDDLAVEEAVLGAWSASTENHIAARVVVDGTERLIDGELDDGYDSAAFLEGWSSCEPAGLGEDPEVRQVRLVDRQPDYACEAVIPADRLGDPIARLSVATLGAVGRLVQGNTDCGFAAEQTLADMTVENLGAGRGRAVWEVSGCTLAFPKDTIVGTDCADVDTTAEGRVTVDATLSLEGLVTDNPAQPIIPLDDTPVTLTISRAVFDQFRVGGRAETLAITSGEMAGTLTPRLARDIDSGACSVPTSHAALDPVRYASRSEVRLEAPQGVFHAVVQAAELRAVNGTIGDETDVLSGTITVNDEEVVVPAAGEWAGLVPDFDPVAFGESFICDESIAQPVTFDGCEEIEAVLVSGAARLSVNHLATVVKLLQADEACGFASAAVIDGVQTTGELGRRGGEAVFTVDSCELVFPEPTVVATDCDGVETIVEGRVVASGTATIRGWLASPDNKAQPVVPDSWTPAEVTLTAEMDGFTVRGARDQYLEAHTGTLSGTLTPQTALDTVTGACSKPTGNAQLSDLTWSPGSTLRVHAGGTFIGLPVDGAALDATSGALGGKENQLSGTLDVRGVSHAVPSDGTGAALDPDYDAATYQASWSCDEELSIPASSDACSFYETIGAGLAKLIVQSAGQAASMINANDVCGYQNRLDLLRYSTAEPADGQLGERGHLRWHTDIMVEDFPDGCPMTADGATAARTDCQGKATFADGEVVVKAGRVVSGNFECAAGNSDGPVEDCLGKGIAPTDYNEIDVELTEGTRFVDWTMWTEESDGTRGPGQMWVADASVTGHVFPLMGINDATSEQPGAYLVQTNMAFLKDLDFSAAEVELQSQGRTFFVSIDSSSVTAFNGAWSGDDQWDVAPLHGYAGGSVFSEPGPYFNWVQGSITLDGTEVAIARQELDPDVSLEGIDDTYLCMEFLEGPIPH